MISDITSNQSYGELRSGKLEAGSVITRSIMP